MLKNYFKIAFRNLWKHKAFSLINILGLTVGMAACFLIFLYVKFELSYDKFHPRGEQIYQVVADIRTPSEVIRTGSAAWAVLPNIKNDFPQLEAAVRITGNDMPVKKGTTLFQDQQSKFADVDFFKVFGFTLLKGDPATVLKAPWSIVLSESTAKRYFGNADPVGQTLLLGEQGKPGQVTGLMKDLPENSQIKASLLISMTTLTQQLNPTLDEQWGNYGSSNYILLKPGTDAKALQAAFPGYLEKKIGKEMKQSQMFATLLLEPFKDVYLHSTRNGEGNINNVYIFSIVAIFILLIACINFINLTTARSTERAKEVGIRKVAGAMKGQLTWQFIGESVLLCLIAFILAAGTTALLLPLFNALAGKTVSTGIFAQPGKLLLLLAAAIGIGLLAGLYPAFVLSSFKPIVVLKGRFATGLRGILLRKGLVIGQFSISIALIIGTIVVYRQLNYMRNQHLGFNKDQLVIMEVGSSPNKEALQQSLLTIPGIQGASFSSSVPGTGNPGAYSEIENRQGDLQVANLDLYFVDFDYIKEFGFTMAAGRPFSREFATDTTSSMIINETAVRLFGYTSPQAALGRRFKQWGREGTIIGVVKDFHFKSLQTEIKPLTMRIGTVDRSNLLSVKLSANQVTATLTAIEGKWKTAIPDKPFNYQFLDDIFERSYRSEVRFGKLFFNFSILAIFISCLGLLGLAAYSTAQRTKEIGIRKVLGASVTGIVNLLSIDFLKLVMISFFVAMPVAWYFMHKWLEGFAYRSSISWWIFVLAGISALVIALLTISFQAIRAAIMSPVKSLKTE